jgi:hypothetical protein
VCVVLDELAFFVVFNPFKKFSSLPVSSEDKKVFFCGGRRGRGGGIYICGMNAVQFKGD